MASVSYGLNAGLATYNDPEAINLGSLAVTNNDIELRFDLTKGLTTEQIILALVAFTNRLATQQGNADVVNI